MEILTRSGSVRDRVALWRRAGERVALLPTAGTLHKGHLRLVAEAQERARRVVVSVFAPAAGRDAPFSETDRELLNNVGADLVFAPPIQELYPFGTDSPTSVAVPLVVPPLGAMLGPVETAIGLTLLLKLLHVVVPDIAVFGERDFLQLVAVRRMVADLFLPVEILSCETLRESDGLALASSNRLLSAEQRRIAPGLYAALHQIGRQIDAGARDYATLEEQGLAALAQAGLEPDYFAIRAALDLSLVHSKTRDLVLLAGAKLGTMRIFDNLRVRLVDRF